jgi:uncharacterized protein (DUF302 family)
LGKADVGQPAPETTSGFWKAKLRLDPILFAGPFVKSSSGQNRPHAKSRQEGPDQIKIIWRKKMGYYFAVTKEGDFDAVLERVIGALKEEGFGVLTEIDVKKTLKKKLDVDFRRYRILGACNPPLAHQALQVEDKIGTMLPCNVIVQEVDSNRVEVAAIDPVASMQAVENEQLRSTAQAVRERLQKVIHSLA